MMEHVIGEETEPLNDGNGNDNSTPKSEHLSQSQEPVDGVPKDKAVVSVPPLIQEVPQQQQQPELDTTMDDVNIDAHEAKVKQLSSPVRKKSRVGSSVRILGSLFTFN
jgi:hypothetical protein